MELGTSSICWINDQNPIPVDSLTSILHDPYSDFPLLYDCECATFLFPSYTKLQKDKVNYFTYNGVFLSFSAVFTNLPQKIAWFALFIT